MMTEKDIKQDYKGSVDEKGLPHGKGTMYYKKDGTHLEGEWFDGNFKGK